MLPLANPLACLSLVLRNPPLPACPQSRVDGALLLDPTSDEVFREEGGLLLALMPTCNEVSERHRPLPACRPLPSPPGRGMASVAVVVVVRAVHVAGLGLQRFPSPIPGTCMLTAKQFLPHTCTLSPLCGFIAPPPWPDASPGAPACLMLQVTQLVSRGQWSSSQLKEGLELAMGGCSQLDEAARQCLREAAAAAAAKQAAAAAEQQQQAGAA